MDLLTALTYGKAYGPLVVAIVFFLWRDWKREDRLTARIDQLEDHQREVILPLVEKCTEVITRNTAALERLTEHHRR